MTTLGDLVNEVHLSLLGATADQEQLTVLSADVSDSATSFTVSDVTQLSTGIIEVNEELMWCRIIDTDSNTVQILARGMYGTTASAHTSGDLVRNRPKFPRAVITRALNDTIRAVYPDLFGVDTTELTADITVITYELPADVEEVLDAAVQDIGPSEHWSSIPRYRVNLNANTTEFASGKTIDVLSGLPHGQPIQVVYRKVPSVLSALTDEFTSSGLAESAKECIVYGACARLVGYTEPARVMTDAAEARFMDQEPAGRAMNASRFFYQLHLQARAEESRRLLDRYPPRIHFTR